MSGYGPPTLAGFTAWVRNSMGITTAQLPDGSIWLTYAFNVAKEIVNCEIAVYSSSLYTLAVYNLGGSNLLNYAQDVPNPPVYENKLPFFAYMRQKFDLMGFVPGVITSASDEGTSDSLIVQEAAKNFTLADLQNLKDPWGRAYLAIAQQTGTIWRLA